MDIKCEPLKVHIFKEYHSVPSSELGSPTPYLASECAPPRGTKGVGGGHTRLQVRGWGSANSDDWRKA